LRTCQHCGEAFKPVGRQRYCSPEHKRAYEVIRRRQWRSSVSALRKWVTAEDAREYRAPRAARYLQLADVINDFESGLSFVPDSKQEAARRKSSGADVSNWPARSAQFVWQLDGRWIKERDRIAYGLPADYEVLSVARAKRMYPNPQTTSEAGVTPGHTCVLNGLYPRRAGECQDCDVLMGAARHRAAKAPQTGVILFLGELGDYGLPDEPSLAA